MITRPCKLHLLTHHFYIVKLGLTRVYIFFIVFLKHLSWVLVRTAINILSKNKKNITIFHLKIIIFTAVKYYSILYGRVILMYVFVSCDLSGL